MKICPWQFCCVIHLCYWISVRSANSGEYSIVEEMLSSAKYDRKVRPGADTGEGTIVHLNMYVNDLSSINEVDMEYTVIIYFRQEWYDSRLATTELKKPVTLNYRHLSKLWVPDVFVTNEKKATFHTITVPNILLRLDPNGKVLYSQRLSLKLKCYLDLINYPFDNQTCQIQFESYGYKLNELELRWRPKDPVQNNSLLHLPEYVLTGLDKENCSAVYVTGTFSCMRATLYFERQVAYFITQTFIPSILIVVLSWVAFWIDYRAVPARITLGLLTILTVTTQSSGISQRLPRVSYTKAIDVWMSTCLVFVFLSLIEYSIVNVLAQHKDSARVTTKKSNNQRKKPSDKDTATEVTTIDESVLASDNKDIHDIDVNYEPKEQKENTESAKPDDKFDRPQRSVWGIAGKYLHNKAQFVDALSRIVFPSCFLVFNIVFWCMYQF